VGARARIIGILLLSGLLWGLSTPASASDEYIAGYAAGILQHEFGITDASVEVLNGEVVITTKSLATVDRGKVVAALEQVPGVSHVEIRTADSVAAPPTEDAVQTTIPTAGAKWLPRGALFAPIHADPRWPHFGGAYREFTQGLNLAGVFAANFGETFAIYRNTAFLGGEWEFGVQAGVFSIFDVSAESIDLVNADYRVGFLSSYRNGPLSGFLRIQHQSSHLGDEFLLNNPGVTRINLSYEEVDVKLSYQLFPWLRLYGGGGYIVHRFPDDLGRGTTQWGIELVSTRTFLGGRLRPVAYGDFQCNERTRWQVGQSIMAGVQFENARIGDRQVQLLAEYYVGPSPDGQFYTERASWYGVGVHLYF
jgi:opacity protein-like surface antigen